MPAQTGVPIATPAHALGHQAQVRELFWHNVVREMLTNLSALSLRRSTLPGVEQQVIDTPEGSIQTADASDADLFDGRLAVVTSLGHRVPIADVHPLFACSINTDEASRALSADVQCTVFRIRTPNGETYTLPLHEIRAVHSIEPELLERLEQSAEGETDRDRPDRPFGFAAFTGTRRETSDPYYPPS